MQRKDKGDAEPKKRKHDDLDTETSFADMNIDGFRWYDPSKKNVKKADKVQLTRKEKRAIMKAAILSMLPVIGIVTIAFAIIYLLASLWIA